MTFGPDGNLYVSNFYGNNVLRFDGATGAFSDIFIPGFTGGLNGPRFLLFTPDPEPPDASGPITSNVQLSPNPVSVDSGIALSATVDDSATGNSSIASASYEIRKTDGSLVASGGMMAADSSFDSVAETVEAFIVAGALPEPGVFEACVRGGDALGNVGAEECIFLVIYDPDEAFVTGGGWIDSPEGAYPADPSLAGKANFGFVSKYKKGAATPTGQTQFQFQDLNFHSDVYDWLVVSGPRAQYKGSGLINGSGDYGFLLTAIDGKISGGGGADKFRIKIWDKTTGAIVYDNQIGQDEFGGAATELGGGSIIIHNK